jgi:serine-type D-Ala-D-Ala carboxypeptidase (penicillin-binding protein 5/6)
VSRRTSHRPALRGLIARFFAVLLGAVVASATIVSLQLPFLHEQPSVHLSLASYGSFDYAPPPLVWPTQGSAAIDVPALDVTRAWHNRVVPIASLTKMMTVYVALRKFPLSIGQTGPCVVVTEDEVLSYEDDKSHDDSAVIVTEGEQLCEIDLLDGVLVHSAANYADILASMVSPTPQDFVARMNATARSLGMHNTHYADDTGVSPLSVSTALDQAKLAAILMRSPLVRSIVDQTMVDLPVAGFENSFTPLVGFDDVIGVKSGRTASAGGCDVMAVAYRLNGQRHILYAVVLGQRGGNVLADAGNAAFALAQSAKNSQVDVEFNKGDVLGTIGFGKSVAPFGLGGEAQVYWWDQHNRHPLTLRLRHLGDVIRRGEVVGWIEVHSLERPIPLVALRSVAAPTLWHRIL